MKRTAILIHMINKINTNRIICIMLISSFLLSIGWYCFKKGEVIEDIGNFSITTHDFEDYYNTTLEMTTRLVNVDKKSIAEFICEPDNPSHPGQAQELVKRMIPENSYSKYRDLHMVAEVAKLDGFTDRVIVKKIVELNRLEVIAQLYIQEKMEKYLKFDLKQKETKCEELRKRYPRRMGHVPYDKCIKYAESLLKVEILKRKQPVLITEIKERVTVKKNNKFDKDNYLKKNVKAYNSLRRIGGCEKKDLDDKKDSNDNKKDKSGKTDKKSPKKN